MYFEVNCAFNTQQSWLHPDFSSVILTTRTSFKFSLGQLTLRCMSDSLLLINSVQFGFFHRSSFYQHLNIWSPGMISHEFALSNEATGCKPWYYCCNFAISSANSTLLDPVIVLMCIFSQYNPQMPVELQMGIVLPHTGYKAITLHHDYTIRNAVQDTILRRPK